MIFAILILAILGLSLSWYIFSKKQKKEKLACFIGDDCNKVIESKYSRLFFIPNEILGILYYGIVGLLSLLLIFGAKAITGPVIIILLLIGVLAALFSIVLIFIQLLLLKEWCEYCLASSGFSIVIFLLEIYYFYQ